MEVGTLDLDVSPGFPHGEIGKAHGHLIEFASVVAFPRISSTPYAGVTNGPFVLRSLTGPLVSNGLGRTGTMLLWGKGPK